MYISRWKLSSQPHTWVLQSSPSADVSRLCSICPSRVHLKRVLCTRPLHFFSSVCGCVYADSVWSFTSQTAAQSPCPLWCMRLWLIERKRGGRLHGEFRNSSANMTDDPVVFFFLLIFFEGKIDCLHLIKPATLSAGATRMTHSLGWIIKGGSPSMYVQAL